MLYTFRANAGDNPAVVEMEAEIAHYFYRKLAKDLAENMPAIEKAARSFFGQETLSEQRNGPPVLRWGIKAQQAAARQKEAARMAETLSMCTGVVRMPIEEAHTLRRIRNGDELAYWLQTERTQ